MNDEDLAKNYYRCSGSGCKIETAECYRCPAGDRSNTVYANVTISGDQLNCEYHSESANYTCVFDGNTGKLTGGQTNCASGTQAPKGLVCEEKRIARVTAEKEVADEANKEKAVEAAAEHLATAFCKACPLLLSEKNSSALIKDKELLEKSCQLCKWPEGSKPKPQDLIRAFLDLMSGGQSRRIPSLLYKFTSSPKFMEALAKRFDKIVEKLG